MDRTTDLLLQDDDRECHSISIDHSRRPSLTPPPRTRCRSVIHIICLLGILGNVIMLILAVCYTHTPSWIYVPERFRAEPSLIQLNHQRWAKVLQKLAQGKAITMGFHGGSISFSPYAYHTQMSELLMQTFPIDERWYVNDTQIYRNETTGKPMHRMISRAAPAMTSDAASLCVSQSFTEEEVDVVSLEYAVNDHFSIEFKADENPLAAFSPTDNIERFARGYLSRPNGPAIVMPLFSFSYTRTAEPLHMKAALHYGIPTVSWSKEFSQEWRTKIGAYAAPYQHANLYTKIDVIHPNRDGHHIMAQLLHSMIVRMYESFIASNFEELNFNQMSRRAGTRQSLLEAPPASLPEPLNPMIKYTSSPVSFCRLMFRTFWGDREQPKDANVFAADGIQWHQGFHPDWKASFRPIDIDAADQSIVFQSPVAFQNAAVLFVFRTWNTTWANGTVHLSSSKRGPECHTKPLPFQSAWSSPTTQTTAIISWSALSADKPQDESCELDLMTVVKTTSGDMRIAGFYAD